MSFRNFLSFSFLFCVIFTPFGSVEAVITRTLSIGSRGPDVKELQIILNKDKTTQVADSGPGSPGFETEYYGFFTAKAVLSFQEKYRNEILSPAGLTVGTGVVGAFTRVKLNSSLSTVATTLVPANTVPIRAPAASVQVVTPANLPSPAIYSISPRSAKQGGVVTLMGENFSATGNSVILDGETIQNLVSSNERSLVFTIPSSLQNGTHELVVQNDKGSKSKKGIPFIVSDVPLLPPFIVSVSPETVRVVSGSRNVITVSGSGFSLSDNTVHSSFGSIFGIKATSESTLSFSLDDLSQFEQVRKDANIQGAAIPFVFGIVNSGGTTIKTVEILLQF